MHRRVVATFLIINLVILDTFLAICQVPSPSRDGTISWNWIYNDDLFAYEFPPSGAESGERLYLGRAQNNGKWIAGKLVIRDNIILKVANAGKEIEYVRFEVLTAPMGSLAWVKMPKDGSIPRGSIVSGSSDSNRTQYVCRGWYNEDSVIPGKYAPYHKKCYVAAEGKEFGAKEGEVLVMNLYANATGVTNKTVKYL